MKNTGWLASVMALMFALTAHAATRYWTNTLGGVFSIADNWDTGVPGTNDAAFFNNEAGPYTVNVSQSATVLIFRVLNDNLNLNIDPSVTLYAADTALNPLQIGRNEGDFASMILTGGGTLACNETFSLGLYAGSQGHLVISNGVVRAGVEFNVGRGGYGSLQVYSNGIIDSQKVILGSYAKSFGMAFVEGGLWTVGNYLVIGWDNVGVFAASNGATISKPSGSIMSLGYTTRGLGKLLLSGSGTVLSNAGPCLVGDEGQGLLSMVDHATMYSSHGRIALGTVARGQACIENATWHMTGNLTVGGGSAQGGVGAMQILGNASVSVGGETIVWPQGSLSLQGGALQTPSLSVMSGGAFSWTGGSLLLGDLTVGSSGPLQMLDLSSGKTLGLSNSLTIGSDGVLRLSGGTFDGPDILLQGGVIQAPSGVNLDDTHGLAGYGYVLGPISGGTGQTITVQGTLTMGDPADGAGYDFDGILDIGANQVVLLDNNRARLGDSTTMADGAGLNGVNGLRIESNQVIAAAGDAFVQGNFYTMGLVNGPTNDGKAITFDDPVSGGGSFAGNVVFNQTYAPGSSPAAITFGNGDITFPDGSALIMEIDGANPGSEYDCLRDIDNLDFNGTLELIFNYTPISGTEFDLLDFTNLDGGFTDIAVFGLPESMRLDTSRLATEGIVRALIPVEPVNLGLRLYDNRVELQFEGDTGLSYDLQHSTNLFNQDNWSHVLFTNFSSAPFPWISLAAETNGTVRYYRIVLE